MHVKNLKECFVNEKSTKTFLKYNEEVMQYFYKKLVDQKANLKNLVSGELNVIKSVYELEIERIEYMLREYLITRLDKMKEDSFIKEDLLSYNEKLYYKKLLSQMIYKNKRDNSHDVVGFICKIDIGNVLLDGESVEMNKDDFYVGPLSDIYKLVEKNEIFLV